jgi:hypothetical protein
MPSRVISRHHASHCRGRCARKCRTLAAISTTVKLYSSLVNRHKPDECIQLSLTQSVLPQYLGCLERYRCLEFAGDNARCVVACQSVRRDFGGVQDVVVRSVRLSGYVDLLAEGIAVSASFRSCPSDHVSTRSLLPASPQCPIQLDQAAKFVTSCTCE